MSPQRADVLARHAVVLNAAAAGTLDALRGEAVCAALVDLADALRAAAEPAPAPAVDGSRMRDAVLASQEAALRGFRNALAFRRWCRASGVPLRAFGRRLWVLPADVDAAVRAKAAKVTPVPPANTNGGGGEKTATPAVVGDLVRAITQRKAG